MMRAKPIGLYVHVPFCLKKCAYCDFCSFISADFPKRSEYLDALCREIDSYANKGIFLDTIFFGGGTPSLLSGDDFLKIVEHIRSSFTLSENPEFTIEANPKTLTEENLSAYISAGVNRVSLGLQSANKNELSALGRIHTYEEFLESYELLRKCGIENVNVDLMYGIPEETKDSFLNTLNKVTALSPEHISVYGLILEEGTPLYESIDSYRMPTEDEECDMYYLAADFLRERGYFHYEISNYAKAGFECRHNLKYWHCEEYIGVGLAAHSYFDGKRFGNTTDPYAYLDSKSGIITTEEALDSDSAAYEFVMLGLRLRDGFSLSEYKALFGKDFLHGREQKIAQFTGAGYITLSNDRIALTEKGFYVSNSILNELI